MLFNYEVSFINYEVLQNLEHSFTKKTSYWKTLVSFVYEPHNSPNFVYKGRIRIPTKFTKF